jgi:hypothetical protein
MENKFNKHLRESGDQINTIEFEKIYINYLIMGRRKSICKLYKNRGTLQKTIDGVDKDPDITGFSVSKRDLEQYAKNIVNPLIDQLIMKTGDISVRKKISFNFVIYKLSELIVFSLNRTQESWFKVEDFQKRTKFKHESKYQNPHNVTALRVLNKIKKLNKYTPPNIGDYISYIITWDHKKKKTSKVCEYAEYTLHVIDNPKIKIDAPYYITRLYNPISSVMKPFCNEIDHVMIIFNNIASNLLIYSNYQYHSIKSFDKKIKFIANLVKKKLYNDFQISQKFKNFYLKNKKRKRNNYK